METPQSGPEGLTLGHTHAIQSMVGTVYHMRAAAFAENRDIIEELDEVLERQLSGLDERCHPYAKKVREILFAERPFLLYSRMGVIDRLYHMNQGLFGLLSEIEERIGQKKGKILRFVLPVELENPEGEEAKSIAA